MEDHRFVRHLGVDPIAIGRALWTDLKAGAFVERGSTITQQRAGQVLNSMVRHGIISREEAERIKRNGMR